MNDKLNAAINRRAQAETLLRNDLLQSAFKNLEADYLKAWGATTTTETEAREVLWRAVQILGDVQKQLHTMIADGKIAQAEINRLAGINRAA